MRMYSTLRALTVLTLFALAAPASHAQNLNPLRPNDELAFFLNTLTSGESSVEKVRIRAAVCVARGKCQDLTITPEFSVGAGGHVDFTKRPLRQRRSQIFKGSEINAKIAELARAQARAVSNPTPLLALMMVHVDPTASGIASEKSDVIYLQFPPTERAPNRSGQITDHIQLKLRSLSFDLDAVINRKS